MVGALWLTIKATNAAVEANRIAREISRRQLRAYVGVEGARITMNDEGELSYRITYKNFGQTLASKVMARTTLTATPLPLTGSLPVETNPTPPISVGVLWPDQIAPKNDFMKMPGMTKPGRFTPEYRDDIATSRAGIFLHGEITYEDIFRDSHRTKFQLIYTGEWGGKRNLIICEEGNEAT